MAATEEAEASRPHRVRRRLGFAIALAGVGLLALLVQDSLRFLVPGETPTPIADVSSERLLALGTVVGFASAADTHAWAGLPFARPPVGPLRWRAPQPVEPWAETRDALEFGRPCFQSGSELAGVPAETGEGFAGEEDCLYLNVWSPRFEPEEVPTGAERLPVMVWIHGGGNVRGWPGLGMYDGARLAGTQGVVVVSIAYRLGPLGWFSHPALRAEAADALEASGNFGTLDQIAALRWVRDHIEEFGGDPENVTIFGESAGGLDVYALMLAPAARGLFHRALSQSGSLRSATRTEAENPKDDPDAPGHRFSSAEVVVRLLVDAGVVPDAPAARAYAADLPSSDLRAFLRARAPRELMLAYRGEGEASSRLEVPKPFRDGSLLPEEDWLSAFEAGRFHDVPVLAGATRDEWKLFLATDPAHVARRFGLLFHIRDSEDFERRARLFSDRRIIQGVHEPLAALARSGHGRLFAYRFDYDALPPVVGLDLAQLLGASHGFELPLLFGTWDVGSPLLSAAFYREENRAERERLSEAMMQYWAAFARDGRPGRGTRTDLPEWMPWSDPTGGGDGRWMLLDDASGGGLRMADTRLGRDTVLARLVEEAELDRATRCELYRSVIGALPRWASPAEYAALPPDGCAGEPSL
ncbi:MAG: carboxylesterase [Deltaproteobacteria bacterium]|nr:carboxylesterase [Deltaproteobacteria bacterium]